MDRITQISRPVAALLGLGLGLSAAWQLAAPMAWYEATPGVVATGAFNAHFVRDIGAAYLTAAAGLTAFAWRPRAARPALLMAASFLALHAAIHVFDAVCGARPLKDTLRDFAGVHLVALVTLGLALASPRNPTRTSPRRSKSMLKALFSRHLDRFERTCGYDASYMRALLAASTGSFFKFTFVSALVDRKAAPAEALAAAGIVGTLAEDCGPCVQISADMGAAAGVPPPVLRAILAGDEAGMGEAAALGWRFARASLARDMAEADPLRDEIVRRWGQAGLVAIALQITTARMYPTLKYALGYGKACSKVMVDGVAAPIVAHPALAA